MLDANTASEKDLLSVPGITPTLAKAILDGRPFLTITRLDSVLGTSLSPGSGGRMRIGAYSSKSI